MLESSLKPCSTRAFTHAKFPYVKRTGKKTQHWKGESSLYKERRRLPPYEPVCDHGAQLRSIGADFTEGPDKKPSEDG